MAICSLIEDYSLVGFETLAVEVGLLFAFCIDYAEFVIIQKDKHSMLHLTHVIDRASGYVFVPAEGSGAPPEAIISSDTPASKKPNIDTLLYSAAGQFTGLRSDVRDVQERWIEAKDVWDAFERREWRQEGERIRQAAATATATAQKEKPSGTARKS